MGPFSDVLQSNIANKSFGTGQNSKERKTLLFGDMNITFLYAHKWFISVVTLKKYILIEHHRIEMLMPCLRDFIILESILLFISYQNVCFK